MRKTGTKRWLIKKARPIEDPYERSDLEPEGKGCLIFLLMGVVLVLSAGSYLIVQKGLWLFILLSGGVLAFLASRLR